MTWVQFDLKQDQMKPEKHKLVSTVWFLEGSEIRLCCVIVTENTVFMDGRPNWERSAFHQRLWEKWSPDVQRDEWEDVTELMEATFSRLSAN